MGRIVLLGLGNEDVGILSRLAEMDPRPEVLAVHSDPEALILRLAAVASYPALTEPPRPRADDIAVISSRAERGLAQMVQPWRDVGARVVSARDRNLDRVLRGEGGEALSAVVGEPTVRATAGAGASKAHEDSKPIAMQTVGFHGHEEADGRSGKDLEPGSEGGVGNRGGRPIPPGQDGSGARSEAPGAEVWEQPEATFQYLAQQVGEAVPVSLWWDGGIGVWVPWVWRGEIPEGGPEEPGGGVRLESPWGAFRVLAPSSVVDRLPRGGLRRVAEDLALRERMRWQQKAPSLRALGRPSGDATPEALASWAEPILEELGVETALLWRREGEGFRLVAAQGDELEFRGTLVLPADLVAGIDQRESPGWTVWDPVPGLRFHLRRTEQDPRHSLRVRRLEEILAGEDPVS